MSNEKMLSVSGISVSYDGKQALRNVSLEVFAQDFIGIIGPNGGGKSTLLKVILGLLKPDGGEVTYYRNSEMVPTLRMGYLPQSSQIDKAFPILVEEVIASGIRREMKFTRRQQQELVEEMIVRMGLQLKAHKTIGALSGGELQRTFLGRALISSPELLILDEPNSYLDKEFEGKLYEILCEANRESAILLVSHNIQSVQTIAKSLACLNKNLHYHPTTQISEACLYETFLNR